MPETNPYKILQVSRTADPETIEDAYDRLFDRYEPLAEAGDDDAVRVLEQLNRAHEVLANPQRRAELDARLVEETRPAPRAPQSPRSASPAATAPAHARRGNRAAPPPTRTSAQRQRSRTAAPAYQPERRQIPPVVLVLGGLLVVVAVLIVAFLISRNVNSPATPTANNTQQPDFSAAGAKATAEAQATADDTIDVNTIPTPGSLGGTSTKDPNFVVAAVNGQPIYMYELTRRYIKDVIIASNDPFMGPLLAEQTVTSTRMLDILAQDSVDKLVNMQVIMLEARAEGAYPNADQVNMLVEKAKQQDLQGMSFNDFLQTNNITAQQYQDNVVRNVVYAIMASKHAPPTGTDEEKQTGFVEWICQARKKYEVKINLTFTQGNQPCTSGLPSDVPLTTGLPTPPPQQQQPPQPQETGAPSGTNP